MMLDNQLEFALKLLNGVCVELLLSAKLPFVCIKTTKFNACSDCSFYTIELIRSEKRKALHISSLCCVYKHTRYD